MSVPMVFTVDGMLEHFIAEGGDVSAEDLRIALGRVGRNAGPALLAKLSDANLLELTVLAMFVGDVWNAAEYPDGCLDAWEWDSLFRIAGYTVDGEPAEQPVGTLTLYRGSAPATKANWSWTDNLATAVGFAMGTGARRRRDGTVWQAAVEPWRLYARNHGPDGRSGHEYVVDTEGLDILEYVPSRDQVLGYRTPTPEE